MQLAQGRAQLERHRKREQRLLLQQQQQQQLQQQQLQQQQQQQQINPSSRDGSSLQTIPNGTDSTLFLTMDSCDTFSYYFILF